jgi:uncharacterized protein YbjT (DUF2867 family)
MPPGKTLEVIMSTPFDPSLPIAVLGSTGRQGGATARALLARGFRVRAVTRSPESEAAQLLFRQGAEVTHGDMDDSESLDAALRGVTGVFSVQNYWEPGYERDGRGREIRQGTSVIAAAERQGVPFFVQSSVIGADRAPNVPHFDAKHEVEKTLKASSLRWTVLRPGPFMQDFDYEKDDILEGRLRAWPMNPDTPLKFVDTEVIGRVAAAAFSESACYVGKTLPVVCDVVTPREMAGIFSRLLGRPVELEPMSWAEYEAAMGPELTAMFHFYEAADLEGDPGETRQIVPNAPSLLEFARRRDWMMSASRISTEATRSSPPRRSGRRTSVPD